jgi:hypothetical protein
MTQKRSSICIKVSYLSYSNNLMLENTIMVEAWIPGRGRKQDRALKYCIDIIEQLRCVADLKDVRKSLNSIIETAKYYRH